MALKPGVPPGIWNPLNDPSFVGLPAAGTGLLKTDKIPVFENGTLLTGRVP
jgi:hypothetical protein